MFLQGFFFFSSFHGFLLNVFLPEKYCFFSLFFQNIFFFPKPFFFLIRVVSSKKVVCWFQKKKKLFFPKDGSVFLSKGFFQRR